MSEAAPKKTSGHPRKIVRKNIRTYARKSVRPTVRNHVRTDATGERPARKKPGRYARQNVALTDTMKNPTRYAKSAWMSERTSEDMSDRMWDGMLSKQERISEGTPKDCWKDMPERMSEWMPESQVECQKVCQTKVRKNVDDLPGRLSERMTGDMSQTMPER